LGRIAPLPHDAQSEVLGREDLVHTENDAFDIDVVSPGAWPGEANAARGDHEGRDAKDSAKLLRHRLASLGFGAGMLLALAWVASAIVRLFAESWIAPINLSPDNDRVIQMTLQLNQQLAATERLRVDLARIEGERAATEQALKYMRSHRDGIVDLMKTNLSLQAKQINAYRRVASALREQEAILETIASEQQGITDATKDQLQAGLIGKFEYQREKQELQRLRATGKGVEQKRLELGMSQDRADFEAAVWRQAVAGVEGVEGAGASRFSAKVPELLQLEKALLQLQLELELAQNKQRVLELEERVARDAVAKAERVLMHLRSRPLFRAIESSTDAAFIPYSELSGLAVDDVIFACRWSVFLCRKVGRIAEILAGEVVTEDPFGQSARGQYAILSLDDPTAVTQRTLRVRKQADPLWLRW
jgi:hypothetical protein